MNLVLHMYPPLTVVVIQHTGFLYSLPKFLLYKQSWTITDKWSQRKMYTRMKSIKEMQQILWQQRGKVKYIGCWLNSWRLECWSHVSWLFTNHWNLQITGRKTYDTITQLSDLQLIVLTQHQFYWFKPWTSVHTIKHKHTNFFKSPEGYQL